MIRTARCGERPALEALYNACFPGEPDFCRWFFDHVYQPENTLVLEEGGVLVSALQMLPVTLAQGGEHVPCAYLYAVGTLPAYRGGGRMAGLLRESFVTARRRGDELAILITQEPSLLDYYGRFGFRPLFARQCSSAAAKALPPGYGTKAAGPEDIPALRALYEKAVAAHLHPVRTVKAFALIGRQYGAQARLLSAPGGEYTAYALLEAGEGPLTATEALGPDAGMLMATLATQYGREKAQWFSPAAPQSGEPNGCALPLTPRGERLLDSLCAPGYLNVLFN